MMCEQCRDANKREVTFLANLLNSNVSDDVRAIVNDMIMEYLGVLYEDWAEDNIEQSIPEIHEQADGSTFTYSTASAATPITVTYSADKAQTISSLKDLLNTILTSLD